HQGRQTTSGERRLGHIEHRAREAKVGNGLRHGVADPSARLPCCGLRGTARPIVVVDPWIVRGECVGRLNDRDAVALEDYRHPSSGATYFKMLSMTCAL